MPKASSAQTSFTVGELSPQVVAREDIEARQKGLALCLNGLPLIQGGWTRRPGTSFMKTTKFGGTKESMLLPFVFGTTQAYHLEFGDLYIRFFTLQGILTNTAQAIEGVTEADPGVVTITGHGYSDGDRLHIDDAVGGMGQLRLREVIVANKTANTFELTDIYGADIDTTAYDTWTSGGTVGEPYEVVTPYAEADLANIQITQSADLLYIFHPDYETRVLTRVSATSFTLAEADFKDGPYDAINTETTTLTPSGTTGSVTITASAVAGINEGLGFLSTDVGRQVRIEHSSTWGYAEITAYTSTTLVTATVVNAFTATTASTEWRLGLFSNTTGFPSTGTFYEDRLAVGGADVYQATLAMSRTGRYTDMAPSDTDGTVAADHGITYALNSNTVNAIRWMTDSERALLVGTSGGEWPIRPSQNSEAVTPSNISGKRSTRHGSANLAPAETGFATLFVQRGATKVREIIYEDSSDGFSAPDVTILSENLPRPGIAGMTYQQNPQSIVYAWRTDGKFLGFTYERDAGVFAWHQHEMGGDSDGAGAPALVESMSSAPSASGARDETYMIVKRYINGTTERYVELMTKIWETGDDAEDAFHLDCGLTETFGSPTSTLEGFWHLEGEAVEILVDGARHAPKNVSNGKIELDVNGTVVTIGYPYNSDGKLMPWVSGAADGSALTKLSKIDRVGFVVLDTLGLQVGPDANNLTEILFRNWGGDWGVATPLFTGSIRQSFEGDSTRSSDVYFRASGPFPATVLAVTSQGKTEDDS